MFIKFLHNFFRDIKEYSSFMLLGKSCKIGFCYIYIML